jgi:hypothetical protein
LKQIKDNNQEISSMEKQWEFILFRTNYN